MPQNDKTLIEKNRLSSINNKIALIKRQHPIYGQLSHTISKNEQAILLVQEINYLEVKIQEFNGETQRILDDVKRKRDSINNTRDIHKAQSVMDAIQKILGEIKAKQSIIDNYNKELSIIKSKQRALNSPEYAQYINLLIEKDRLEIAIQSEPNKAAFLSAYCYDEKQRRLLPINIKAELAHHLGSDWGSNLMNKHPNLLVSYTQDKVEILNADKKPEISTSEKGGLMMYQKPSKNEKLADLMMEMYFKSFENILDKAKIHSTSGPDADFLGKKIAIGLQQRGYLDHKVNGKLVTDILGIEKTLDQPNSPTQPEEAATVPSVPSPASVSSNETSDIPLPKEEKETSPTLSTNNNNEPELPEWYIKQLEANKIIENDPSHSFKM